MELVAERRGSGTTPMRMLQERFYTGGHDYADGSPHIRHHALRSRIVAALQEAAREVLAVRGTCRVLEVGAGHGTFTDHLVATGAEVVVTEMSAPSAAELTERFRNNDRVTVVLDPGGSALRDERFDLVVCVSVLHHIPDYLSEVRGWVEAVRPGGGFVSFQDPLLYARRSRVSRLAERGVYLLWRLPRGDVRRGVAAVWRRQRGELSETELSDMVEYHVVRGGVDEQGLCALLEAAFEDVTLMPYWSAQSAWGQAVGSRWARPTTFGVRARRRC